MACFGDIIDNSQTVFTANSDATEFQMNSNVFYPPSYLKLNPLLDGHYKN